ncbi:hypothetical protein A2685_00070 [Candidatus Woesebacteria bacterium RIFCSPHIGHO2_01_FULL_37_10]|uniref:Uncharacterized protein n=1 Tax=Candidatus Woesebacteria bacterium RIFCSPHIGHO2_01_FULL_37_10 TaxID=1802489 RepID=A0A1F7XSG3_9BACT|nr:MAG: hypothetical protein A2685_00070 [Candidatus Woesebacteria bacterium RIFCSPHIGHO2_01_FULL_37_10]
MGTEQKINEPNTLKWIVLVEQTTRGFLRDNPLQEGYYEILVKGRIRPKGKASGCKGGIGRDALEIRQVTDTTSPGKKVGLQGELTRIRLP